ncbi:Mu transposase C-terminal domain-containing protein [Rubrivivax gelatinosus]|uniref:Integrase catalytic subunit n=1 Tax=Rubrivivax gelatinosus (strain NBRC 100245 / IL144) TaxID=983917 RepID=I0HQ35_RUBGI|nr:Mu transposase C-terminal domain-containing protein [Rubrivivax gelatinosus]BAL95122.1 integrase catalytic subunit [Rubrivivax gelatinosus IL144]
MRPSLNPSALTKERLTELFDCLGVPPQGRQLVQRAMVEAPVRDVYSSGRNVVSHFHSRKNGTWIGTESRHVEFPAAVVYENDAKTLAYFPQPFTRVIEHVEPDSGEVHTLRYTPDFLVLRDDGITVVECKPHATLLKESAKRPFKYRLADDGSWYSPLFEAVFGELGLQYRVISDLAFSKVWVENCLHLADYLGEAAEPCPDEVLTQVRALLAQEGRMTLHELVNAPYSFSADHLLKAVADGALVANLQEEPLYEPRCAWLYRDEVYRDFVLSQRDVRRPGKPSFVVDIGPGALFRYSGETLTVALVSDDRVVLNRPTGGTFDVSREWLLRALEGGQVESVAGADGGQLRFHDYSDAQLATALHRRRQLEGGTFGALPSARTMSRLRAKEAAARASGGNEDLALVPMTHLRGNRTPRLDPALVEMMRQVHQSEWRDASAKNYRACHNALVALCASKGLKAPSYPTFIGFIKRAGSDADVRIRQSSRYAYQQQAFVDSIEYEAPVHGSRPLQYVHIDHTQVDLECLSSRTGRPLGRPWLTLAVCATTREIVGLYLTFEPPSYRSVMMVIRDMVRRHGRMPEFVVVDNGSDLRSMAFAAFLQMMGTHLRARPKGSPRHGAVMERLFGKANTEFIHNLAGNTKATRHVRMVTGKSLPVNNAEWTLESLYYGLCYWAFTHYAEADHPALAASPKHTFERLQRECGSRPQRRVLFNRDFLIATCPPADRGGVRMVNRQTGVKVFDRFYWHQAFRDAAVADTQVDVRYDPFDASSVYVRVKQQWVQARHRALAQLPSMSEAAFKTVSEEYRRRFKPSVNQEHDLQRLVEFLSTFTPEGATAAHMERLAQSESLVAQFGDGPITPPERATGPQYLARGAVSEPSLKAPKFADLGTKSADSQPDAASGQSEPLLDDFDSF